MKAPPRPLAGIRVLDFSTLLPGPLATLMLTEAGAEVIKIEHPRGEEMRRHEPAWGQDSVSFAMLNRAKKSIAADLKDARVRDRILELAKTADIVVEQFRPGVMERLGLGFNAMRAVNAKIIYCAISGYGQTGPRCDRAGHDLNYIGDSGLLAVSCGAPGNRVVPPALIADIAGGAYPAMMNIVLALRQRDQTGEAQFIDIAMAESVFAFLFWGLGEGAALGRFPGNGANLLSGGSPRYNLYDTKDGRIAAVAALEQKFWEAFTRAIDLEPALCDDSRDPAATIAGVRAIIASRDASEWSPIFDAADCCGSIVQDLPTALNNPHFKSRGIFDHRLSNETGAHLPALPVPIAEIYRGPHSDALSAPALGANNAEFGFLNPADEMAEGVLEK